MKCFAAVLSLLAAAGVAAQEPPPTPRIVFGGFGDAVLDYSSRRDTIAFDHGEVDLFVLGRISDNWSVLGEGFFQHVRGSGDVDKPSTKQVEMEVERLYLAYNPSDRLRLEIGQIHTGIIRWNEREHRSRFLQTPIDVPAIANREEQGGAWPLHFGGVWASGRLPGSLGLQYGAGIGTARGTERDELQPVFDARSSPAGLVTLSIAPDALSGFEAGGAAYHGHIPAQDGRLVERDTTLFASFVRGPLELHGEWARMDHRRYGVRYSTLGWYALASYRLSGQWQRLRPYVLVDELDVAPGEAYLSDVPDQDAFSAGVRWDMTKRLSFKGEFVNHLKRQGARDHVLRAQVAISF